jgi:alpha-tubulin suppressor-like RCC1 family protein
MDRLRRLTTLLLLIGCVVVGATGGVMIASHTRAGSAGDPPNRLSPGVGINGHMSIAVGEDSACAIAARGRVDCWGVNPDGLLGVGVSAATGCQGYCTPRPTRVLGISRVVSVAVGNEFACALLNTGLVDCWGADNYGQLGVGESTGPQICQVVGGNLPCARRPVAVTGIRDAVSIGAGGADACAVVKGGETYCWGAATDGVLGDESEQGTEACDTGSVVTGCNPHPAPVFGVGDATAVAVGSLDACALVTGGRVTCWGDDGDGQLGDRTTTGPQSCTASGSAEPCSLVPVLVHGISGARSVSVGVGDACALLQAGAVDCWGDNALGELGTGSTSAAGSCGAPATACATMPQRVVLRGRAAQVSAGFQDACAVLMDGKVDCWGAAASGALGTGKTPALQICVGAADDSDQACLATPRPALGLANAVVVSAGVGVTCARQDLGGAECWGENSTGQLGDGINGGPDSCTTPTGSEACATTPRRVGGMA